MSSEESNTENRKKDHIELAIRSQTLSIENDSRFYYEPFLSAHPQNTDNLKLEFLQKKLQAPIWISSMTGGAEKAGTINRNLAKACNEFGLAMGLGSCRSLLHSFDHLSDFQLRNVIGDQPFYANLGIAQIEKLIADKQTSKINELIDVLEVDGLIIHINPLQEWMQPEGDKYYIPPVETIKKLLEKIQTKLIVKEVGQGFGYKSLEAIFNLPVAAIELSAFGGTNFTKLEMLRKKDPSFELDAPLFKVGHTAAEMVDMINELTLKHNFQKPVILSGGIQNYLDGYYLISKCKQKCVYGQASSFLKYAAGEYEILQQYIFNTIQNLSLAKNLLTVKA